MPEMLVRLKRGKKTYEVMVQEGMVTKYREGKVTRQEDVVLTPVVFTNASNGTKASAEQLTSAFETDDMTEVIDTILRKGEAQESAGERKEKADAKRQEIITAIQKGYVSMDGRPLPVVRIENALTQLKPRIDVDQPAERQVTAMMPKLTAMMQVKRKGSDMEGIVSVPMHLSGVTASVVRKYATVQRETYHGERAKYEVEIYGYNELIKELGKATKGDFEFALVNGQGNSKVVAAPPTDTKGRGKKKKRNK